MFYIAFVLMNRNAGSLFAQLAWSRSNRAIRFTNTAGLGKARNGTNLKHRVTENAEF